jgi:hypothetical protein
MSQDFGRELPGRHVQANHRPASRYLVVIPSGGVFVARLLLASRVQVAEFDAGAEEASSMTRGLQPTRGAVGAEWDCALAGHSPQEREAADVYELSV